MSSSHSPLSQAEPAAPLLRVENLHVHFPLYSGQLRRRETGLLRAVDGVSFTLRQGEALALIGAPRCGKTTVARVVALLQQPTAGRILYRDQDLTTWRGRHLQHARRSIQMLFSNPYSAFAPRMTVEQILNEALSLGEPRSRRSREQRLAEVMAQTGLNLYLAARYPRDLSGGNRQRLAVARALATDPTLLVCDQPADCLDPGAGAALVDLLQHLRQRLGLALLLTAREFATARHADRVAVMVLGRIVEMGYRADVMRQPLHPFTQALLQQPDRGIVDKLNRALDPQQLAPGCRYAPACPWVQARCHISYPPFVEGAADHGVACHLVPGKGLMPQAET